MLLTSLLNWTNALHSFSSKNWFPKLSSISITKSYQTGKTFIFLVFGILLELLQPSPKRCDALNSNDFQTFKSNVILSCQSALTFAQALWSLTSVLSKDVREAKLLHSSLLPTDTNKTRDISDFILELRAVVLASAPYFFPCEKAFPHLPPSCPHSPSLPPLPFPPSRFPTFPLFSP